MSGAILIPTQDVQPGMAAYPRGEVVSVTHDSPLPGWATIEVQGGNRWDLRQIDVSQYSPRRKFRSRGR